MDIEAYSLYYSETTYNEDTLFTDNVISLIALLTPLVHQNLKRIYQSRKAHIPYIFFMKNTTDIIDMEKKIILFSVTLSQILKENGYECIYLRVILINFLEHVSTPNIKSDHVRCYENITQHDTNVDETCKEEYFFTNFQDSVSKNPCGAQIDSRFYIPSFSNYEDFQLVHFSGFLMKTSSFKPFLRFLTYKCSNCKVTVKIMHNENKTSICKCKKAKLSLNEPDNIILDYNEVKIKGLVEMDCIFWSDEAKLGDELEGIGIVKLKRLGNGEYKKYIDVITYKNRHEYVKERNDSIENHEETYIEPIKLISSDDASLECTLTDNILDVFEEIIPSKIQNNEDINVQNDNQLFNKSNNANQNIKYSEQSNKRDIFSQHMSTKYIKDYSENQNIMQKFSEIIFKDIYGYEDIKNALILSLFGGSNTNNRSSIHILLIGDPGLGKSKLLNRMSMVLPRSQYTCATTSSSAGLTLSCADNETIMAGTVAICNNGICCIDEFDKLKDPRILYEVMEDEKMTYNKGGLYYRMKVSAGIIAATNPKSGTFKKTRSIKENINFDDAMLNRFDLVFALVEEYNENKMRKIIGLEESVHENTSYKNDIDFCDLDEEKIRAYILYCRENINPILSTKAKHKLKTFWLELRKNNVSIQSLQSLKRLTEARAKINMREIASEADAEFVISLYKKIYKEKQLKKNIHEEFKLLKGELMTKNDIILLMQQYSINKDPEIYIERLNYQGYIVKKSKDLYKIN
ncbi:DNA replication licensing factor mcm8 [Conglomerata obtusa]